MRDEKESSIESSPAKHSMKPWRVRRATSRWMSVFALVSATLSALSLTAFATPATAIAKTPTHATPGQMPSAKDSSASTTAATSTKLPSGIVDASEPSGEAPPGPNALPRYEESYVNDFTGSSLPTGWSTFAGEPGSDAGAQWAASHVVVGGGVLELNASQDPAFNDEWVTGGLCQCGVSHTYGAYFVRSRLTGAGPTQVELLWPVGNWPPEIDFDETYGGMNGSMATLHYTSSNDQIQRTVSINMTQWHTWGVIWTPASVTYTVDGHVWGVVNDASAIPDAPMTLDIQQQTWCSSNFACPTSDQSTYVDWVAEYTSTPGDAPATPAAVAPAAATPAAAAPVSVAPFASNSSALSPLLKAKISKLAKTIRSDDVSNVSLVGFTDNSTSGTEALAVSTQRAAFVARYLELRLQALKVTGVKIKVTGAGSSNPVASNATPSGRAKNRRVVVVVN
jgi:outer membrane protein OmpA-like peptidoglycan-associated protein